MKNIRNFSIISHVDHGKSTLADRFLELTETVSAEKMRPQYLDTMDLEREKGITIKMQPVRMQYKLKVKNEKLKINDPETFNFELFTLNLIDTPGHVDFSYEVSRALAAVEGAILLVDAAKGIQAQTIANLELAKRQKLVIIPVVNKIDLPNARIEETTEELANLLDIEKDEILKISAKFGTNIDQVLRAIIERIPSPRKPDTKYPIPAFRALIFDSKYDSYKGVIVYVRIMDGEIEKGENIYLIQSQTEGEAKEVGIFKPELTPIEKLTGGEIGYIATGIKETEKVKVGDTITILNSKFKILNSKVKSLPGYQEPKPMVFASFYTENPDEFDLLKESLVKLKLNDPSLTFEPERKEGLGRGFRCGFLGTLHAEIVSERLSREYDLRLVISSPSVLYKIINKENKESLIKSATDWPEDSRINEVQEPWAKLEVIAPVNYLGGVLEILERLGGRQVETRYLSQQKTILIYEVPLREIIYGLYDNLKSQSQGYASMNYEFLDYRSADLVKLEILVAGERKEAFSKIVPRNEVSKEGRRMVKKLKEILPPQLFSVPLQAAISGKIMARETIRARGKDVLQPLYGGDYTRKRKLLEKQKRGKLKLKEKGEIRIPQNIFFEMFRS